MVELNKEQLHEYKEIALDFFTKNKIRICIEEAIKNENGNPLFGIKVYKKDGSELWFIENDRKGNNNIFVWETEEQAAKSLDNYFLPNVGYKLEQNKIYHFHELLQKWDNSKEED